MSPIQRRIMLTITPILWVAWVGAQYVTFAADHKLSAWHSVGTLGLMLAAGLSTVALLFGLLVAPMIQTAKVWHEIGSRTQCAKCECGTMQRATRPPMGSVVIPIRPVTTLTSSDF